MTTSDTLPSRTHRAGDGTDRPDRPAHERAYLALRDMALFGDLAPGQPVTIQGLTALLDSGMTPVREAIRRLTAEGALMFQGNRRVSVPVLRPGDVEELIFLRKSVETELARRAARGVTPAQIATLTDVDTRLDRAIAAGDIRGYLQANYRFHAMLYGIGCAPVLFEVADRLWLRFGPSLRVVCGRLGTQNLPDRHKDILTALHKGDSHAAAEAVALDVEQGLLQVLDALPESGRPADSIDSP